MKKIISTIAASMIVFSVSGQQKLSYIYDAAGNRTNRTIVVAAQSALKGLEKETSLLYVDFLDGKELAIRKDCGENKLSIAIQGYRPSFRAGYSILDSKGKFLSKNIISREISHIEIDALPSGNYTLHIFLNRQASAWTIVKL